MVDEEAFLNAALRPRFFFVDVGALVGFPLVILHMRVWTFAFALLVLVFFFLLELRGLRPATLMMMLRLRLGSWFRYPFHISRRRYHRRRLENR